MDEYGPKLGILYGHPVKLLPNFSVFCQKTYRLSAAAISLWQPLCLYEHQPDVTEMNIRTVS